MKKILIGIKETRLSGSTAVAIYCLRAIQKKNLIVHIICKDNNNHDFTQQLNINNPVEIYSSEGSWFKYIYVYAKCLHSNSYSIIHSHSSVTGYIFRTIGIFKRKKIIHTIHGISFHKHAPFSIRLIGRYLDRLLSKYCNYKTICVNNYYKETYFKNFKNVEVIHNPYIPRTPLELNTTDKKTISNSIIFCGRLDEQKDPITFLSLVKSLKEKGNLEGWKVEIFGTGKLLESTRKQVRKNNLQLYVNINGWVDWQKFQYKNCIHIVTSKWEAFGLNIVEMADHGIPTIAYSVEGIPEVITDGKTGILVEEQDFEDLIEQVTFLMHNPSKLKELGLNAQSIYPKKFNLEEFSSSYKKLYDEILYN